MAEAKSGRCVCKIGAEDIVQGKVRGHAQTGKEEGKDDDRKRRRADDHRVTNEHTRLCEN